MEHTKLVVIIPALNEAKTVGTVIHSIPRTLPGISQVEVLVINDGSKDTTEQVATQAGASVINHSVTMGVGAAFHTGIRHALARGATIIVNIDADGQFNPLDIPTLIEPIQSGRADFVTTTRFANKDIIPRMPGIKIWGNRMMTNLINFVTGKKFTDVSCGFRAYSRQAALKLTLFGHFTYTQETLIDLANKNIAMVEVPLKVRGEREFGNSRVASNLWRYGIKSATIIFRAARDYYPFYFFGVPGLTLFGIGAVGGLFLLGHYVNTGQTYPYRSLVQVSGILIIVGVLLFFLSLLADMMHRNRQILEEMLYLARKEHYRHGKPEQS